MMQLKYMVINTDETAENLLAKWKPEPTEIHFFRASSNYVHIFKVDGAWRFLRFSRVEERDLATLEAELEFLMFLQERGYPAAYPMLSEGGRFIETAQDSHGEYYGLVFQHVPGKQLSAQDRTPEQYRLWGEGLGRLHNLSREFTPQNQRRSYLDYLADFRKSFLQWEEQAALAELELVQTGLAQLNQNDENYGLIHYDFQYDNTFWNHEENTFYAIDFDDAHYHFYVMDLVYAMEDLDDEGPKDRQACIAAFYGGYKSASPLDESIMEYHGLFQRYSNLMHFWRIARSLQDSSFPEDPDWLAKLRPRLVKRLNQLREGFKDNVHAR